MLESHSFLGSRSLLPFNSVILVNILVTIDKENVFDFKKENRNLKNVWEQDKIVAS